MNKSFFHRSLRIFYNLISLSILIFSLYKIKANNITLYPVDYIFLSILIISFILVSKYSIRLKSTNLNFSDFIIIVCYMKFNIYCTVLFIFICYLIIFVLEYKNSRKLNLLTENIYIINNSIIILAVFISNFILNLLDNIYYIRNYETATVVLFSLVLLSINYILYCIELSFQKNSLVIITLENGLYFILLNFLLCTIIASLAIFLYRLYDYVPIIVMTVFIIFISYSLSRLDKLKVSNHNLRIVNECTGHLISNTDFKVKLQRAINIIEDIVPFIYCGIYWKREKYDFIYPVTYKCNNLTHHNDLKFLSTTESIMFNELWSGSILYKDATDFSSSINIVNTHSYDIKYSIVVPIKNDAKMVGFIFLCLNRYIELDEELELLSIIGSNLGMINYHINATLKSNIITYKNYDGVFKYIDYNIKRKIFFTLALMEIENYNEIIEKYNRDFYETLKAEIARIISTLLSSLDNILCFEKEDIYIVFNLLDSKNAENKLNEISEFLSNFRYKDIPVNTKVKFSVSEYPIEGVSGDEILDIAYRKLHHLKKA